MFFHAAHRVLPIRTSRASMLTRGRNCAPEWIFNKAAPMTIKRIITPMANSAVYQSAEKQHMQPAKEARKDNSPALPMELLAKSIGAVVEQQDGSPCHVMREPSWIEDSILTTNSAYDSLLFTLAQSVQEYVQAAATNLLLYFLWNRQGQHRQLRDDQVVCVA